VGVDGTPLLGRRTGIGRYVDELLRAMAAREDGRELVVTAFTLRGAGELAALVPPGVSARPRRLPARGLQAAWARSEWPRIQLLTGRVDAFHGTNFILPPTGRAGGVVTVHDLAYLRMPDHVSDTSRRLADLVPRSLRRAAAVCVPSAAVAGELEEAYPSARGRVVVTPLGVDPGWLTAPRPTPAWLAARQVPSDYLVFVGTVEPRKDLATLLAAYRRLAAEAGSDDVPALVVVGPKGWGADPSDTAVPGGTVVRLDHLAEADLRMLVAGSRALVYPSLYEGFGLPLLEAFACGVPVIASDIPTTREVLGSAAHLAGLFPVGDAEALVERLRELPGEGRADAERSAARRAHAALSTWQRTAELTAAAYDLAGR
jgi:glycosyltransferase involved in cell wall biosynthesis